MRDGSRFTYDPTGTDPDPPMQQGRPQRGCLLVSVIAWAVLIGAALMLTSCSPLHGAYRHNQNFEWWKAQEGDQ